MTIVLVLALFAALGCAYWLVVRPWLRARPRCASLWARIDAIEAALWARSRTILWARLYTVAGAALAAYDVAMPALASLGGTSWETLLPERYRALAPFISFALVATGQLFEQLRKVTVSPVDAASRPPAGPR